MPRHVADIPVRRADLDADGHVDSVVILRYLQEARVDMLFVHGAERGAQGLAEGVVVVRHEVDYVAPLRFRRHPVRVELWVSSVRGASFTVNYEVVDIIDGEGRDTRSVFVRAATMLAPYDLAEQRLRRLTAGEKVVLEGFRG